MINIYFLWRNSNISYNVNRLASVINLSPNTDVTSSFMEK